MLVVDHQLLLGPAGSSDPFVALGVVGPRHPRGHPPARHALHGTVDVEHLEQQLQAGASHVDRGFQRGRRQGPPRCGQGVEHLLRLLLTRHRHRREIGPDVLVLGAGQQQHVGTLGGTSGAADLLVVRDRRARCPEVHDEAEVGLVEPHPERGRRDESLDLVAAQRALEALAIGGVGATGVRRDRDPGIRQRRCHVLSRGDGQRVDDAAARQLVQVGDEPAQSLLGGHRSQHPEAQ